MDSAFHAKSAYISGASRGIGRAIAEELASLGYNLSLTCKNNPQMLEELKEELIEKYHVNILTFTGDVSNFEFMEMVCQKTMHHFHTIDVIVNNAGISYIGLLTDMSVFDWDRVISTDLSSAFYSSKLFVPHMINQKFGKIINISSMWGSVGASMEVCYSAAKGGLNSFTKALSKELAPSNISVNAISCGVIDTEMNHCFSEEEMEALIEDIPAGRLCRPDEVAKLVSSIISAPNYMTGQIIGIDGGYI